MSEQLYLNDHYQTDFEAKVLRSEGKVVELDRCLFCPEGGGQPSDTGILRRAEEEFKVLGGKKREDTIFLELDREGLVQGDEVVGIVDWHRRLKLMRSHTAAHVISGVFAKDLNALITGNQLSLEGGRIDFNLEDFDKDKVARCFDKANELIQKDLEVKVYWKPREEVERDPGMVKLAMGLPPGIKQLRIVDIVSFDAQPDGGTHISHLKEIGRVEIERMENKGKANRRVYFKVI